MRAELVSRLTVLRDFILSQHFTPIDLKNLFSWSYWTEAYPDPSSPEYVPTIVFLAVVVAGLMIWRSRLKKAEAIAPVGQRAINQLANVIAFIIIVAASYLFFRTQTINYLSSRLVILTAIVIVVLWLGWIIVYQQRVVPAKRRQYLERERFFRYIPKSKEKVLPRKQK